MLSFLPYLTLLQYYCCGTHGRNHKSPKQQETVLTEGARLHGTCNICILIDKMRTIQYHVKKKRSIIP